MNIKQFKSLVSILLWLSSFSFAVSVQAAPQVSDNIREAGDIVGSLTHCGQVVQDMDVFIRGTSYRSSTDGGGNFKLSYVQQGIYDIVITNGSTIGVIAQVSVLKKQITNTGPYDFCLDSDGDGYNPPVDCNDSNPNINPSIPESCGDGIDNNCNDLVDEGCEVCTDLDNDGFFAQAGCGFAIDCDDDNPGINPLATEMCDGIDNNCDGVIDGYDSIGSTTYYYDADSDGHGDQSTVIQACSAPANYVINGDDCDDSNPYVSPSALEIEDGLDNDCDGVIDEVSGEARYDSNGTFYVPLGITQINVELSGGGAGGGSGVYSPVACFPQLDVGYGGGGGGSGGVTNHSISVLPGERFSVVIGLGGDGGSDYSGNHGGSTVFSSISERLTANGGMGGQSAASCNPGSGGSGGPGGKDGSNGRNCEGGLGGPGTYGSGGDGGSGCSYNQKGASGSHGMVIISW